MEHGADEVSPPISLLGATIGVGTIAVIVALGPAVDLTSRLLRLDVHQGTGAGTRAPS